MAGERLQQLQARAQRLQQLQERAQAIQAETRAVTPNEVVPFDQSIDRDRGAPANVRAAVGAAIAPEDRLATIRRFFPDAQPYDTENGSNFVFTDPETNRVTLYNPPGLDFGDIPSIGPELSEAAGGSLGAVAGALSSAPTGGAAAPLNTALGAGAGATLGREGYNALAEALMGTVDTRGIIEQAVDPALTFGMNAVGQRAGDAATDVVARTFGGSVPRPFSPTTSERLVNDFGTMDVRLLPGAVTGNRALQIGEQALGYTPGGAPVIQRAQDEAVEQLGGRATALAGEIAGGATGSPAEVVETISRGAGRALDRFRVRSEQLYDRAYEMIPADSVVEPSAVEALERSLRRELAQAPSTRSDVYNRAIARVANLLDDAEEGVTFDTWRSIRTELGRELKERGTGQNELPNQLLERIYAAISDDMGSHALQFPEGAEALRTADRYFRFNVNQNAPFLDRIVGEQIPERIYTRLFGGQSGVTSGLGVGGSQLRRLRNNLEPEEWDTVAGSFLQRIGMTTPANQGDTAFSEAADVFSPQRFITNWNRLSPEAKRALFGGSRYEDLVPEIDRLVRVSSAVADSVREGNPSGTARQLLFGSLGAAGGFALSGDLGTAGGIVASAVVAPNVAARLLTNEAFVRWLATSGARTGPRAATIGGDIARLYSVFEAEPEIREELMQYVDALRSAERAMIGRPGSAPQGQ